MATHRVLHNDEQQAIARRMVERRWLWLTSSLIALGLLLVYQAKTTEFRTADRLLDQGALVNLNALASAESLRPIVALIEPDSGRHAARAAWTYARIEQLRSATWSPFPVRNVGLLNTSVFDVPDGMPDAGSPLLGGVADLRVVKPMLVVRTPSQFLWLFLALSLLYFLAAHVLHAYWFKRRFGGDPYLLPLVHVLAGLGLVLMFSLPDPLRDVLRAQGFVGGWLVGCVLLGVVGRLDVAFLCRRVRPGHWLTLGGGLAVVLYIFGTGPTGSDAKVNLSVPLLGSVQPVEAIKLCLILFLAAYFAHHGAFLRELTQRDGMPRWTRRWALPRLRDVLPVVAGVAFALAIFVLLRDMGPALIVGCTFLALYGVVRQRWVAVGVGALAMVAAFWATYASEALPMVAHRVGMLLAPWDNFVPGGEHLAHALWALATGGFSGQGLGQGHPAYIPAAHTDMVLPAFGEEVGFLGLIAVLVLYLALLARALHIALRSAGRFSAVLGLAIGFVALFQIGLIVGGTFGLVPLSGVVTPFLSYGKSSMMAHCVMVGMLASLSARPGVAEQRQAQALAFRRPAAAVLGLAVAGFLAVGAKAAYVQLLHADDVAMRPALIVQRGGERAFVYNPRIYEARAQLTRGTIRDRNGLPLATSDWREIEAYAAAYDSLGIVRAHLRPTDRRHYPFRALTFYLLGDVTSRVKWGAANSLYAEHAFLSHLRGYDNAPQLTPVQHRPDESPVEVVRYDYGALTPLVRRRAAHPGVQRLLQRDRDLTLTVDVRLQQRVAEVLTAHAPGHTASAVVLDARTGAVLASVTTPLPAAAYGDPTAAHADPALFDRGFGHGAKPPGSTLKLVTAMAALNADPALAERRYTVRPYDRYARRGEPVGEVDLERAIIGSSNVYFAALAHEIGPEPVGAMLRAFGFRLGARPRTPAAQREVLEAPDNLRQVGFGQGPVTGSPLHLARVAATIAADGLRPPIRWVEAPVGSAERSVRVLSAAHARLLAATMRRVVTDDEGTAKVLRTTAVPMAGKTGTAEEIAGPPAEEGQPAPIVNHAWFAGFAPYGPAERHLAIAVLVEAGGSGGRAAAPIAGAIAEAAADLGLLHSATTPGVIAHAGGD